MNSHPQLRTICRWIFEIVSLALASNAWAECPPGFVRSRLNHTLAELTQNAQPSSRAQMAREWGVESLEHDTNIDNLVNIMRAKQLVPRNRLPADVKRMNIGFHGAGGFADTQSGNFVYMSVKMARKSQVALPGRIKMRFDLSLLEREDFHISKDWSFGEATGDSWSSARLLDFLKWNKMNGKGFEEVVFGNSIPLDALKEIHVAAPDYERVIDALESNHVSPPPGKKWTDIVIVDLSPSSK